MRQEDAQQIQRRNMLRLIPQHLFEAPLGIIQSACLKRRDGFFKVTVD
jgi:hypothetical protein